MSKTKYTILYSMVDEVWKKIRRIINKCEKNNILFEFNMGEPYTKLVEVNNKKYELTLIDLELDVTFKFNGWESLGLVQRKDGIVQCYFKDSSLIKQYKDTDFHCDHCHKNAHRNSIIVLEHESGVRKIVGTSCVKEFTSGLDGNLIAEVNDYLNILKMKDSELNLLMQGEDYEDDVDIFCERNGVKTYNVIDIVSASKRIIDEYGFESSGSMNATWKFIMDEYDPNRVEAEAESAIDWIKALSEEEVIQSTYLFNLRQIIEAGYCTSRHFGLLASLIPSYRKSEYKRLLNETDKKSEYVGNIGDKLSVIVTYVNCYVYDTRFGTSLHIYLFSDENGNIFKWNTGTRLEYEIKNKEIGICESHQLDKGSVIKLSGTIKSHDEYRNQKQTVLTRCKYEVISSKERDEKLKEIQEALENNTSSDTRELVYSLEE